MAYLRVKMTLRQGPNPPEKDPALVEDLLDQARREVTNTQLTLEQETFTSADGPLLCDLRAGWQGTWFAAATRGEMTGEVWVGIRLHPTAAFTIILISPDPGQNPHLALRARRGFEIVACNHWHTREDQEPG